MYKLKHIKFIELKIQIRCSKWVLWNTLNFHHDSFKGIQHKAMRFFDELRGGDGENQRYEKCAENADYWLDVCVVLPAVDTNKLEVIYWRDARANFELSSPIISNINIKSKVLGWSEVFPDSILLLAIWIRNRKQEDGVVVLSLTLFDEKINALLINEPVAIFIVRIHDHFKGEFLH